MEMPRMVCAEWERWFDGAALDQADGVPDDGDMSVRLQWGGAALLIVLTQAGCAVGRAVSSGCEVHRVEVARWSRVCCLVCDEEPSDAEWLTPGVAAEIRVVVERRRSGEEYFRGVGCC